MRSVVSLLLIVLAICGCTPKCEPVTCAGVTGNVPSNLRVTANEVLLDTLPNAPKVYYVLSDTGFAVLMNRQVVIDELRTAAYSSSQDYDSQRLATLLESSAEPDTVDLNAYVFQDARNWTLARRLVVDLLSSGSAEVVDLSNDGTPVRQIIDRDISHGGIIWDEACTTDGREIIHDVHSYIS